MALLMPVEERKQWMTFVRGLSDYFNSPGRLVAVRRQFESVIRRPAVDPAIFATELGILAMQGFDSMGEHARGLMIRNKLIAAQPSRALRRHLDGTSAEASIGDIVDSCRVWESHAEDGHDGPDLEFPHTMGEEAQPALGPVASDMLREDCHCRCRHCRLRTGSYNAAGEGCAYPGSWPRRGN